MNFQMTDGRIIVKQRFPPYDIIVKLCFPP